ncbi:MAG: glycosyltransferase [Bacteroidales bacterium]
MQPEFRHIVLTRFNLVGIGGEKSPEEWRRWNEHRFRIFRTYCLPSMLQQSAPFTWHLYFDVQTPEKHRTDIEQLKQYPFIRVFFMQGKEQFFRTHMEQIRESIADRIGWLITTRVDNDDCLHRDALARIQRRFRPRDMMLINLSSGYTFNLETRILSHYYYLKSPFMSMVEDLGKATLLGIFYKRHTHWEPGKAAPWGRLIRDAFTGKSRYSYVVSRPSWLQLVHEENVSNDERRGLPVLRKCSLEQFGITERNNPATAGMIPGYYHFIWWKRYLKGWILMVVHRIRGK